MIEPKEQRLANAVFTNSLVEILSVFGNSPNIEVLELSTKSHHLDESGIDVGISSYGLSIMSKDKTDVVFDYKCRYNGQGQAENPLDKFGRKKIEDALVRAGIEDMAVERLVLLWKDNDFGKKVGKNEDEWIVVLIADKPSSSVETKQYDAYESNGDRINEGNRKYRGFKRMILNIIEIGSSLDYYTKKETEYRDGCFSHWWGNRSSPQSLVCPITLVQHVTESIPLVRTKRLDINKEDKLVCVGVN